MWFQPFEDSHCINISKELLSGFFLADNYHDYHTDWKELVRAIRELDSRVRRLERRLEDELGNRPAEPEAHQASTTVFPPGPRPDALESRIGSQWLNKAGVVAVLFGVAYLLRYAFVRQWISARTWIWVGVCTGIAVVSGSEWFRQRGYRVLSLSLKATGIGVSYLSLWAGLELYKLLSGPETFAGLVFITVLSAALALRESAEVLLGLALIGGFLTPLLILIPSQLVPLFLYLALLDFTTGLIVLRRGWSKVFALAFCGTVGLSTIWYFNYYSRAELSAAVPAATVFFAIFFTTSACTRRLSTRQSQPLLTFMEVINPVLYFASLYQLLDPVRHYVLAIPALGLSGLYFIFAARAEGRVRREATHLVAVYGGLAIAFIAAAIAVLLRANWLSLGWFLEAAVVMAIGFWQNLPWLRWGALLLLCAAIVKAFAYDVWQLALAYRTLSFIGLGVLLLVISFVYQRHGFSTITKSGKGARERLW
jgi:uncharacterized membrane protein